MRGLGGRTQMRGPPSIKQMDDARTLGFNDTGSPCPRPPPPNVAERAIVRSGPVAGPGPFPPPAPPRLPGPPGGPPPPLPDCCFDDCALPRMHARVRSMLIWARHVHSFDRLPRWTDLHEVVLLLEDAVQLPLQPPVVLTLCVRPSMNTFSRFSMLGFLTPFQT